MKKEAYTIIEILITMVIIAVTAILAMNSIRVYLNRDTDIIKFKHAFATLSNVIGDLKKDTVMYPKSTGFADMTAKKYPNENITYSGAEKFKQLFTSRFNILEGNINIKFDNNVPLIKYTTESTEDYTSSKTINCFMENKGLVFCPPSTQVPVNNGFISSIYIPMYINKIEPSNSTTTELDKVIFIEVTNTGKIEIPPIVEYQKNKTIIDCTNKNYNNYSQCKVLDKLTDVDF